MNQRLPLWPLRVGVHDRLSDASAAFAAAGFQVRSEGAEAEYPFADMGPALLGDDSTDTAFGSEVFVQVDFWASQRQAGGKVAAEMMDAATQAVSSGQIDLMDWPSQGEMRGALYQGIQTAQLVEDRDAATGEELVRGLVRYRFSVYQS